MLGSRTPETLRDLLDAAGERGTVPAVMALQGDAVVETLSGAELAVRALAVAGVLSRSGVGRGEPIVLAGANSIEWIVAYFAIVCSGALPVPLDSRASGAELAHNVSDCGARRGFLTRPIAELLRAHGAPALEVSWLDEVCTTAETLPAAGVTPELPTLLPRLRRDDIATLFYTSGTTGTPKGVPLSHGNILANVEALITARLAGEGERVLLPLPLHHVYPLTCGLLGSLALGATLVLPAGVTGPQLRAAIRRTGATMLLGVPRLYSALLTGIEAGASASAMTRRLFRPMLGASTWLVRRTGMRAGRFLFARLHRDMGPTLRTLVSGGARLDAGIAWALEGLGWQVLSGYGLTETAPMLTFNIPGQVRHESVGRPLPGVLIRIDAPPGQSSGEILVRGPNVFAGYRNQPQANEQAFTADGWLRTGDLGFLDADGYLHICGRVRETIVLPDGKKLFPEEVENLYLASALIREAALLEHEGRLVALIVPDENGIRERGAARIASLLREEIEAISLRLPAHQRITDFRISHEPLPRTPMGKLQRFRLPAVYAGQSRNEAARADRELSAEDRTLLGNAVVAQAWAWLQQRFAGRPLALDASPQLDLQMDSLEWLALTLEISDRFGVQLGQDAVGRVFTVRDLLQEILAASDAAGATQPVAAAMPAAGTAPAAAEPGIVLRALGWVLLVLNRLLMRGIFRLRVEGAELLPSSGPVLIAPNHASYLDPMAIAAALPWRLLRQTRWAGWSGFMFRAWHWRLLSRATGVFSVDPDRGPAAAINDGAAVLAAGQALVWFPEGRRSLTGEIGTFLPGIGLLLARSASPVVPAHVDGSFEALPWNRRWPRLVRLSVRFGAPLASDQLATQGEGTSDAERIASGLRRAVVGLSKVADSSAHDRSPEV